MSALLLKTPLHKNNLNLISLWLMAKSKLNIPNRIGKAVQRFNMGHNWKSANVRGPQKICQNASVLGLRRNYIIGGEIWQKDEGRFLCPGANGPIGVRRKSATLPYPLKVWKEGINMSLFICMWKNKNGTGVRSCKCGSWKKHWINFSEEPWPEKCCVSGCTNPAKVGAHVISDQVAGEFIVPMCTACNAKKTPFCLKASTTRVSANKQKTCER